VHLRKVSLDNHVARIGNYRTQAHYRLKYRRQRGRCGNTGMKGSTY